MKHAKHNINSINVEIPNNLLRLSASDVNKWFLLETQIASSRTCYVPTVFVAAIFEAPLQSVFECKTSVFSLQFIHFLFDHGNQ